MYTGTQKKTRPHTHAHAHTHAEEESEEEPGEAGVHEVRPPGSAARALRGAEDEMTQPEGDEQMRNVRRN
jgi:hypothetical protein